MANPTASKQKPKKLVQAVTKSELEQLLADQASLILNAVHEKLSAQERRFNVRLEKMEERFAKSLDQLTRTLDKFLKLGYRVCSIASWKGMATGADSANCPTRAVRRTRQRRGFYISVFRVAFSDACLTSAQ